MTLEELIAGFDLAARAVQHALMKVGDQIGKDAVRYAQAKLGNYQPAVGFFPAWAELADSTIEEKLRLGLPSPSPLLRSGDLKDSIQYSVEREGQAGVVVNLFSDSEYAPAQEMGTLDGHIPPRPFLGPTAFERSPIYAELTGVEVELSMVEHIEYVSRETSIKNDLLSLITRLRAAIESV